MSRQDSYNDLLPQIRNLIRNEPDRIANMANISALLFNSLSRVNWVGFYRVVDNNLILGPFQGNPACIRIRKNSGVCGTASAQNKTVLVSDVHQFPGHIACDPSSRSEIVIPCRENHRVFAVLDIDSPVINRFDDIDKQYLEII